MLRVASAEGLGLAIVLVSPWRMVATVHESRRCFFTLGKATLICCEVATPGESCDRWDDPLFQKKKRWGKSRRGETRHIRKRAHHAHEDDMNKTCSYSTTMAKLSSSETPLPSWFTSKHHLIQDVIPWYQAYPSKEKAIVYSLPCFW